MRNPEVAKLAAQVIAGGIISQAAERLVVQIVEVCAEHERDKVASLTARVAELEAENHDLSVAVEGAVIAAHALHQEVAAARRAAIEECERIAREHSYEGDPSALWIGSIAAREIADAIAELKDTP